MQTALGSLQYWPKTPNESAMIFKEEPAQVVGAPSGYFASEEEESTWVEHLLAEPVYDDILDPLLDHNACAVNVPKSYYFSVFSATEPVLTRSNCDALQGSLTEQEKTREKFLGGLSNGYDANYCSMSCEAYLLDTEFKEETPTFHDVTTDISCIADVNFEDQLADSVGRNCDIDVLRLSNASTSSDHDILRFDDHNRPQVDDMSTDKLLKVFREMFGWETSIADKQLLENITFGMQSQDMLDRNFKRQKCSMDLTENEGAKVTLESRENLLTASTAFASVFNFRTKPRVQHVKKREHIQWDFYKCQSSAARKTKLEYPEKRNSKIIPLTYRKSCQSTMCNIAEFAEENVKCNGRKLEISEQYLKCKLSQGGFDQQYYDKVANTLLGVVGKRNSQGERVQIQPGISLQDKLIRMQDHLSEDCRANRAHDSDIHEAEAQDDPSYTLSDESNVSTSEDDWIIGTDTLSDKSNDSTSEDDRMIETKTRRINRHRKTKYWSTPEVLKLVKGVSKYGVGRWADIKRIFFRSSVHRSPPDLKDKWRNLVNASCRRSQRQRWVDKTKKQRGSPSIPQHVLDLVRELAVIYPNSKLRRARVLPTVFVTSSSNVDSDNRCFSVNDYNDVELAR